MLVRLIVRVQTDGRNLLEVDLQLAEEGRAAVGQLERRGHVAEVRRIEIVELVH